MNPKIIKYLLILVSTVIYFVLNNLIERGDFAILISGVIILGGIYFYFLKHNTFSIKEILLFAFLFRAVLMISPPNLSDDYYRFVLDGQLQVKNENPYLFNPNIDDYNPKETEIKFYKEVYEGLNSKNYYTVYTPLNQYIFKLSSYLSGTNLNKNVFYLKFFILLFEMALIILLLKMLKLLKRKENLAIIYAFNPLVVIELVGNVHFEGMMLFFLLFSLYFLQKNKIIFAGILFGMAINTKLIPLIFLPLILRYVGLKKSVVFYFFVGIINVLLFAPFFAPELFANFSSSINLYFKSFEFNASLYYLFREIGYWVSGYNQINVINKISSFLVLGTALFIALKNINVKNIIQGKTNFNTTEFTQKAALILFVYFLLASILTPWYVINLVLLSIFFTNRVYLIWSITVFLSYFAYSNYMIEFFPNYAYHDSWLYYLVIFIEYSLLIFYYLYTKKKSYAKLQE